MKKRSKPLIAILLIFALAAGGLLIYRTVQRNNLMKEPVDNIFVEVTGVARAGEYVQKDLLTVRAVSRSGISYIVRGYGVSESKVPEHGASFDLDVEYRGITKSVTVPITRKPKVEYKIGYPNQEDVVATVYENGDLTFAGSGQIINIGETNVPWKKHPVMFVDFDESVEIESMDGWFSGNSKLLECKKIPRTVKSLKNTFSGCTSLKETPEYFRCKDLNVMINTFSGCKSLVSADAIPVSVIDATGCFSGCVSLKKAVDMTKTSVLERIDKMYSGCTLLIEYTQIPQTVRFMSGTFENCSNLRSAAAFPLAVEDISGCYMNCSSLESASTIPEGVKDASGCYSSCPKLHGDLEINTDSKTVTNCLNNSVFIGNTLYISGNSGRLIEIQSASGNKNIVLKDPEEAARQKQRMQLEMEAVK